MKQKILDDLNALVKRRGNEIHILYKLKHLRWDAIGEENLNNLITCFKEKDKKANKKNKYNMSEVSTEWFGGEYSNFMEFFGRPLVEKKMKEISDAANTCKVIIPNECNIESIGTVSDPSSIIRLKKSSDETRENLKELGVPEHYTYVNMKLLVSYYHNIHSPVSGTLKRAISVEKSLNFFGKNSLWFLEFETQMGSVYMLLVGESSIQDFNFSVSVGDKINISEKLGNFMWGSQTLMFFDANEMQLEISPKNHYFLGQPVLSR